ncbi:tetratricopeptide repeat protein [Rhodanobacter ginsengisoli]|uniref:Tetratricopeptide repeat protein n=1 Tax=Rhodanobacter ginsengisoli TaxID=418646 RepID=A0ABW0QHV8_9GAMM
MVTWVYAAVLAFSTSTATPAPVALAEPEMPRPEQVMAVPPELRAQLQQKVIGAGGSSMQRLQRLVDFMFQESDLGMQYATDATLTVGQAYRTRKANCLTFTLLTVALAREAGLRAYAQEIEDALAWREEGGIVYRSDHVNTGIAIGQRRFTMDVARDSVLVRHPPKTISDQRLLALYYNNRAAELMAGASPAAAVPYMMMSLQLDAGYANSWSNAGVLQLRLGDLRGAERDYLKALALDPVNTGALFNLVTLYQNQGDEARSAVFKRRLEKVQLKDPYYQFLQALDDEKQGDFAEAVKHYKQAIHLYDSEPLFYFGLARAYQQLGDQRRARHALGHAHRLSQASTDEPYQAGRVSQRQ